jgi:NAD+ synthase
MTFSRDVVKIDPAAVTDQIVNWLRHEVVTVMRRRGGVLGISGGVDSSVVLALCARAFGPDKVVALLLPEKDSESESGSLACKVAAVYGVEPILETITGALDGFGCYQRRDEAIQRVFPEYDAANGYTAKIVLPNNLLEQGTLNFFSLTIITPEGEAKTQRLKLNDYFQIVAASNFKQRTRMSMLYYHAELRNYAVIGTANKNEHMQGFFVKHGDGGVDIRPIVHLYKSQIYQLAEYLGVPEEIRQRPPTSDTYSAAQTQEEFFFRLPFHLMDLIWYALEHDIPTGEVAAVLGMSEEQVKIAQDDIVRKQRTTDYLRMSPLELAALEASEVSP